MNAKRVKLKLSKIISENPGTIMADVAQTALEADYSYIKDFFSDLLSHGCISGMISHLVYYADTQTYFDKHYDEIEEIRFDLEDSLGEMLKPQGDLKNWYSWLAFEETARKIAQEIWPDF